MQIFKTPLKNYSKIEKVLVLVILTLLMTLFYEGGVSAFSLRDVLGESSEASTEVDDGDEESESEESEASADLEEGDEASEYSESQEEESQVEEMSEEISEVSQRRFRLFGRGEASIEKTESSEMSVESEDIEDEELSENETSEPSSSEINENMFQANRQRRISERKRLFFLLPVNVEKLVETDAEGNVVSQQQTLVNRILEILSF